MTIPLIRRGEWDFCAWHGECSERRVFANYWDGPLPVLQDEALRDALLRRELPDAIFDALYTDDARRVAHTFWTPLRVAHRVANLLQALGTRTVLDAGSGAGKFCIAAATSAPELRFTGVEQRAHLVDVANDLAVRLRVENVRFIVGDATRECLSSYDAAYFYNPFCENIYVPPLERVDDTVELSPERFRADIRRTEEALQAAPKGLVVITYYGFGGRVPDTFELAHVEQAGTDCLRVWRKVREGASTEFRREDLVPLSVNAASAALGRRRRRR